MFFVLLDWRHATTLYHHNIVKAKKYVVVGHHPGQVNIIEIKAGFKTKSVKASRSVPHAYRGAGACLLAPSYPQNLSSFGSNDFRLIFR